LTRNPVFSWIPAPRLRGDKFTAAKAGAGMSRYDCRSDTPFAAINVAVSQSKKVALIV
jgi:hypothetical protein